MKVLLVSLILFETFLQGHGIRCTIGTKIFAQTQIPGQAVQTQTCTGQDTCFTARYSATYQGQTVSGISGLCLSDASRTCPSEVFCKAFTKNVPFSSNCKGTCCYTDDCNKDKILNATAAGHMFKASIFIAGLSAFVASKLMG